MRFTQAMGRLTLCVVSATVPAMHAHAAGQAAPRTVQRAAAKKTATPPARGKVAQPAQDKAADKDQYAAPAVPSLSQFSAKAQEEALGAPPAKTPAIPQSRVTQQTTRPATKYVAPQASASRPQAATESTHARRQAANTSRTRGPAPGKSGGKPSQTTDRSPVVIDAPPQPPTLPGLMEPPKESAKEPQAKKHPSGKSRL